MKTFDIIYILYILLPINIIVLVRNIMLINRQIKKDKKKLIELENEKHKK